MEWTLLRLLISFWSVNKYGCHRHLVSGCQFLKNLLLWNSFIITLRIVIKLTSPCQKTKKQNKTKQKQKLHILLIFFSDTYFSWWSLLMFELVNCSRHVIGKYISCHLLGTVNLFLILRYKKYILSLIGFTRMDFVKQYCMEGEEML
jgi:hypothetical protein